MKAAVPMILTTLALAGCGAQSQESSVEDFRGTEREVAQKIEDLQSAGESRKPEDICGDILASRLVDELEQAGAECAEEMQKAIDDADDYELVVREVTVTGTSATARVQRGDKGPTETMQFTRERGQWRATSLSAP